MQLIVRRALPSEFDKYRQHLLKLDADSRYLRFGYMIKDEMIVQLCDQWQKDASRHVLFVIEDNKLDFLAVGHVAMLNEMELAFSVLPQCQRQGMGSMLMVRVIQWCRTHGHLNGCMVCLSTNTAIRHLCQKHGINIRSQQGETMADIHFDSPNITTYLQETTAANLAMADYVGKRMARFTTI